MVTYFHITGKKLLTANLHARYVAKSMWTPACPSFYAKTAVRYEIDWTLLLRYFLFLLSIMCWNIACGICCHSSLALMLGNWVLCGFLWPTTLQLNLFLGICTSQSFYLLFTKGRLRVQWVCCSSNGGVCLNHTSNPEKFFLLFAQSKKVKGRLNLSLSKFINWSANPHQPWRTSYLTGLSLCLWTPLHLSKSSIKCTSMLFTWFYCKEVWKLLF